MSSDPFDTDTTAEAPAAAPAAGTPAAAQVIGADARREQRVRVSWPARLQLPTGKVLELRVRDLSDGGVGFVSELPVPTQTVMNFALGAPALEDPKVISPITGSLKVLYVVLQQGSYQVGAVWAQVADPQREVISRWVRRFKK